MRRLPHATEMLYVITVRDHTSVPVRMGLRGMEQHAMVSKLIKVTFK